MTLTYSSEQGGTLGTYVTALNRQGETIIVLQPVYQTVSSPATPAAGTVAVVTTGGTAVTVVTGPINGGFVTNPANAARQGIVTAEPLYINLVGTPLATEAGANGSTSALDLGQTFVLPALAAGVTAKVNAATNGHKFSVEVW